MQQTTCDAAPAMEEQPPARDTDRPSVKLSRRGLLATAAGLAGTAGALAQPVWPTRPVRLIVPYLPGSSPDVNARLLGDALTPRLGQPVVIEDRPGAATNVGSSFVARQAAADGHILLFAGGPLSVNPFLYARMDFDPLTDLAPVSLVFSEHNVVVVPAESPIRTLEQLVEHLRTNPNTTYASSGYGGSAHLSAALFLVRTGTQAEHIPFRGAPEIVNALLGQTVTFAIPQFQPTLPQIRAGTLRALAVTSADRSPLLPDVPAVAEMLSGYEYSSWMGIMAPARVPPFVVNRLAEEVKAILADPGFRARVTADGTRINLLGPEAYREFLVKDAERGKEAVRLSGARIE